MELSNREIAYAFWVVVILVALLRMKDMRQSLWRIVRAACQRLILLSIAIMLTYVTACISILYAFQIWQWDNLKTTFIWVLTYGLITMFRINNISEDDNFYWQEVRDAISVTAVVIFIAEIHSFHLVTELVLLPCMTLFTVIVAYAQVRPEGKEIRGLLDNVHVGLGFTYFFFAALALYNDPEPLWSLETLRNFSVPILLSIMFLPFIFALSLYVVYENLTNRLIFAMQDEELRHSAKVKSIYVFAGNLDSIRRWSRNVGINAPTTTKEVEDSFKEVLIAKERERERPHVPFSKGWSPYDAQEFLPPGDLATGDYHRSYDSTWHAMAKPYEIPEDQYFQTINYTIEGNERTATRLELSITIINPKRKEAELGMRLFEELANLLSEAALPESELLDKRCQCQLQRSQEFSCIQGNCEISLRRSEWKNNNVSGMSLTFFITHNLHVDNDLMEDIVA